MKDGLQRSAKLSKELPEPEEESQYADFFSAYHKNDQPMIARNGTSITWPAGWSEVRAHLWRARHGMAQPAAKVKAGEKAK